MAPARRSVDDNLRRETAKRSYPCPPSPQLRKPQRRSLESPPAPRYEGQLCRTRSVGLHPAKHGLSDRCRNFRDRWVYRLSVRQEDVFSCHQMDWGCTNALSVCYFRNLAAVRRGCRIVRRGILVGAAVSELHIGNCPSRDLILAAAAGCGWVGPTEVGQKRNFDNLAQSGQPSTADAVIRCRRKYDSRLSPRLAPARNMAPARVPRRTAA